MATAAPPQPARVPLKPEQRLEEVEIALEAAHEVNRHLNSAIEKLASQLDAIRLEKEGYEQRVKALSKLLAHAKSSQAPAEAAQPGGASPSAGPSEPAEPEALPQDEEELALRRLRAVGAAAGWLADPQEVVLGEAIGEGSFGTTRRALWRGGAVAVKCLRPDGASSLSALTMFLREVESLARVRHPNVVAFYGACLSPPDRCWLLCEHMAGGTLGEWLYGAAGARRPPARGAAARLRMALDVARGMQALEQSAPPVVHRDIKPSNVLIDASGTAKVADLGLSRVLTAEAAAALTGEVGSYSYMSPECIRHEAYGPSSDVWSWGVLALECWQQQRPYSHLYATPVQVAISVADGTLVPEAPAGCPDALAALLSAVFQQDPDARPSFGLIVAEMARIVAAAEASEAAARQAEAPGWGKWLASKAASREGAAARQPQR